MKIGDIVKNRNTGEYDYSTFGISIHVWNEETQILWNTLGRPVTELTNEWVVADVPNDYKVHAGGGIQKI